MQQDSKSLAKTKALKEGFSRKIKESLGHECKNAKFNQHILSLFIVVSIYLNLRYCWKDSRRLEIIGLSSM